jgi:hypothetical protein
MASTPRADVTASGITVSVTVRIEMTGDQVAAYASEHGLPREGGPLRARHIVEDVRSYVLTAIHGSAAFGEASATVTLK